MTRPKILIVEDDSDIRRLYAIGLNQRGFEVKLPTLVAMPIELLSRVFTPLALFTLGCQLADSAWTKISWGAVSLVMVLKL